MGQARQVKPNDTVTAGRPKIQCIMHEHMRNTGQGMADSEQGGTVEQGGTDVFRVYRKGYFV